MIQKSIPLLLFSVLLAYATPAQGDEQGDLQQLITKHLAETFSNLKQFRIEYTFDRSIIATDRPELFDNINPGYWEPETHSFHYSNGNYRAKRNYLASSFDAAGELLDPAPRHQDCAFDGNNQFRANYLDGIVTLLNIVPLTKLVKRRFDAPLAEVNFLRLAGIQCPNVASDHRNPYATSFVARLVSENENFAHTISRITDSQILIRSVSPQKTYEIKLEANLGFAIRSFQEFDSSNALISSAEMSEFKRVADGLWIPKKAIIEKYHDKLLSQETVSTKVLFKEEVTLTQFDDAPEINDEHFVLNHFGPGTFVADGNLKEELYCVPGRVSDFDKTIADYGDDFRTNRSGFLNGLEWPNRFAILFGLAGCSWLFVLKINRKSTEIHEGQSWA